MFTQLIQNTTETFTMNGMGVAVIVTVVMFIGPAFVAAAVVFANPLKVSRAIPDANAPEITTDANVLPDAKGLTTGVVLSFRQKLHTDAGEPADIATVSPHPGLASTPSREKKASGSGA